MQHLAYRGRRGRIAGEKDSIDIMMEQCPPGRVALQVDQCGALARHDTVGLEQHQCEEAGTAALGTDRDPGTAQFGQARNRSLAAIEDRQRLIEDRTERYEIRGFIGWRDARLHQRNIDRGLAASQLRQIVERTLRRLQAQPDAAAREDLLVALAHGIEGASGGAGSHRQRMRWRRAREVQCRKHRQRTQQYHGSDGLQQLSAAQTHESASQRRPLVMVCVVAGWCGCAGHVSPLSRRRGIPCRWR